MGQFRLPSPSKWTTRQQAYPVPLSLLSATYPLIPHRPFWCMWDSNVQVHVLLEGGTDVPGSPAPGDRATTSGDDGKEEADQEGREPGVFTCALGGLPLFLLEDELLPARGKRGRRRNAWPGFPRPVHPEHVVRAAAVP